MVRVFDIEETSEGVYRVPTNRGGSRIFLSGEEENAARQLAQQRLERRGVFNEEQAETLAPGKGREVFARASFIARETERGAAISFLSSRGIKEPIKKIRTEKISAEKVSSRVSLEKEKRFGVISAVQKERGLERLQQRISEKRSQLQTESLREKDKTTFKEGGRFVKQTGLGIASSVIGQAQFIKALATKPKQTIISTAKGIKEIPSKSKTTGKVLREEPGFIFGRIAGDIAGAKVIGKIPKTTRLIKTRISPGFKETKFETPKEAILRGVEISGKKQDIFLTRRGTKELEIPIKQQIKLAGKEVKPVSAAIDLFGTFKRKVVVEKPAPKGQTLERAFFADPFGRARIKRLKIQKEAGLLDILTGDIKLFGGRTRPQVITFGTQRIEKFPRHLKGVEKKLKLGKSLSSLELKRLELFQLKPSGKFKPLGFRSKEPEVILAPGETIFKKRTAAVTILDKEIVEIIEAEIKKTPRLISPILKKERAGKPLSLSEIKKLERVTGIRRSPISIRPRVSARPIPFRRITRFPSLDSISPLTRRGGVSKISPSTSISRATRRTTFARGLSLASLSRVISPRRLSRSFSFGKIIPRGMPPRTPRLKFKDFEFKFKKTKQKKKGKFKEIDIITPDFTALTANVRTSEKQLRSMGLGKSILIRGIPTR